jgi:hypothetical protein
MEVGVSPVDAWYHVCQDKSLINFGASAGHIPARMAVLYDSGTFLPRSALCRPLRRICSTLRPETSSHSRAPAYGGRPSPVSDSARRRRAASALLRNRRENSVSTGGQNRSSSLRRRLIIVFTPGLSPVSSPQIGPGLLRSAFIADMTVFPAGLRNASC